MPELSDEEWQRAVLAYVIGLHPERLSPDELRRAMTAGGEDADAHDRAAVALIGDGLLRRDGGSIVPTRAVLRYVVLNG